MAPPFAGAELLTTGLRLSEAAIPDYSDSAARDQQREALTQFLELQSAWTHLLARAMHLPLTNRARVKPSPARHPRFDRVVA